MKATIGISILAAMMALAGGVRAQSSETNGVVLPVIELQDVPLPQAIDRLARLADYNYLLDPTLFPTRDAKGKVVKDRSVSFRMENVTAKAVLVRMLELQHLVMAESPGSRIAIITRDGSALTKNPPSVNVSTNDGLLPLIQFGDVPMATAIENLARQAEFNYLIDPQINMEKEPSLNARLTRVSAKDALIRMLFVRGYVVMEDPVSNIAIITHANQSTNRLFMGMSEAAKKSPWHTTDSDYTNEVIPLIQFSDVPMTTAIENLARQSYANYMLVHTIYQRWSSPRSDGVREPLLNLRLEQVTAWNALNRMLNAYKLVIVDDPITHIWQIRGADDPGHQLDASLLDWATNNAAAITNRSIPLIQFSDVPLWKALDALIRQDSLPIALDPRLRDDRQAVGQLWLSLRWEDTTAKQAIIALCQNYDLVIVKEAEEGKLRIEPGAEWK